MRRSWALGLIAAGFLGGSACSGMDSSRGPFASGGSAGYGAGPAGGSGGPTTGDDADSSFGMSGTELDPTSGEAGANGLSPTPDGGDTDLCPQIEPKLQKHLDSVLGGAQATGSATAAAEFLKNLSRSPLPVDLRTQDFLNFYAPKFSDLADAGVSVRLQLRAGDVPPYFDLLVALQAPELPEPRPEIDLSVVLDNTESIGEAGLERAQAVLEHLLAWLRPGDALHLLTATPGAPIEHYDAQTPLAPSLTLAPELDVLDLLPAAYDQAKRATAPNRLVVLISDGQGDPLRITIPDPSIRLAAIGIGPALEFGHRLLRSASRQGDGPYVYVDSGERAAALDFNRLFFVWATGVSLELTLPWYFTVERPFAGGVVPASAAEKPYLAPGQTSVFLFRLVACHPDIPMAEPSTLWASATFAASDQTQASAYGLTTTLLASPRPQLDKAYAVLGYAEALRSLDGRRLDNARKLVETLNQNAPDPDLASIAELLALHPGLTEEQ
jgi:hypothetical protein